MCEKFVEEINTKQEWSGNLCFDPDSSPKAWGHYKKYYNEVFWTQKYDFEKLHFFVWTKDGGGNYVDCPIERYNRLVSIAVESKPIENSKGVEGNDYYNAALRLGGDTDFNFKEEKHSIFLDKLKNSFKGDELVKHIETLKKCKQNHYTLINFSLMQVMGNMQGFKSRGLLPNRKEEWLDRLDTLVYWLNEFFNTNEEKEREKNSIIQNATWFNRKYLLEYLNSFNGIKDYCEKVYFIKEEELVERLIESGSKEIDSGKRVVEYMSLALEFWEEKKKYFKENQ